MIPISWQVKYNKPLIPQNYSTPNRGSSYMNKIIVYVCIRGTWLSQKKCQKSVWTKILNYLLFQKMRSRKYKGWLSAALTACSCFLPHLPLQVPPLPSLGCALILIVSLCFSTCTSPFEKKRKKPMAVHHRIIKWQQPRMMLHFFTLSWACNPGWLLSFLYFLSCTWPLRRMNF